MSDLTDPNTSGDTANDTTDTGVAVDECKLLLNSINKSLFDLTQQVIEIRTLVGGA